MYQEKKPKVDPTRHPIANKNVLEATSLELGVSLDKVREVVSAQSEFTALKIREGGLEGVMWPIIGKFRLKVSRLQAFLTETSLTNINKNTRVNK